MLRRTILTLSVTSLVLMMMMPAAFAFQLNAVVSPASDKTKAIYRSVQVIYIEYPEGGQLKSMLENIQDEVIITADKNTPGVNDLINRMNNVLVKERRSPAIVDDLVIDYKTVLKGENEKAVLEQSIKFDVLLTNFVIQPGAYDEPALIDLNWRGFRVAEPVIIETEEYGELDINLPSGYLYVRQPEVMSVLENTEASRIVSKPHINYEEFTDLTLDRWHSLFNPIGAQTQGEEFGFIFEEGAKAITVYSSGEGSLREGIVEAKTDRADVAVDGVSYIVRSTTPPSSATIDVLGWAQTDINEEGDEGALVYAEPPAGGGGQAATGGFPIQVLAVFGGIMAAIAGFVLWRANKK